MKWFSLLLLVGAVLALGRIALSLRQLKNQRRQDWDTRLIERLRRSGANPFRPHELDFFLALPSESSAALIAQRLSTDGFAVDTRTVADNAAHPFSVHARKAMPLSVDEVRAVSVRLRQLAEEHGGRYDGWAAAATSEPRASE